MQGCIWTTRWALRNSSRSRWTDGNLLSNERAMGARARPFIVLVILKHARLYIIAYKRSGSQSRIRSALTIHGRRDETKMWCEAYVRQIDHFLHARGKPEYLSLAEKCGITHPEYNARDIQRQRRVMMSRQCPIDPGCNDVPQELQDEEKLSFFASSPFFPLCWQNLTQNQEH